MLESSGDERAGTPPRDASAVACARSGVGHPPRSSSLDVWEQAITRGGQSSPVGSALMDALEVLRAQIHLGEGARTRLWRPIRGSRRLRIPQRPPGDTSTRLLMSRDGKTAYARRVGQVDHTDLVLCHPMRDFSRRNGQWNKPVAQFSHTVGDLVACESQHERKFVWLADWSQAVIHIASQPFTIEFPPEHEFDSHTPDFALLSPDGAIVIVDVKWPGHVDRPAVVNRHRVVQSVLAEAGMQHVVWSEVVPAVPQNIALFAAARVPAPVMLELAPKLLSLHRPGVSARVLLDAARDAHDIPTSTGMVILRRLLWDHRLAVDMNVPFTIDTEIWSS